MESDAPPAAEKSQPKLRWFQYRLRSLFLLTLVVAIGMSWLTVTMRNQRQQKAAAEAIEKAGGVVTAEPTWLGKTLRDDSLVSVTKVGLSGESISETVLVHLERLRQLQRLFLGGALVTDAVLVHLQGLRQLQRLDLDSTKVTDAGLVHLARIEPTPRVGSLQIPKSRTPDWCICRN